MERVAVSVTGFLYHMKKILGNHLDNIPTAITVNTIGLRVQSVKIMKITKRVSFDDTITIFRLRAPLGKESLLGWVLHKQKLSSFFLFRKTH
jgi:hypothetical protein